MRDDIDLVAGLLDSVLQPVIPLVRTEVAQFRPDDLGAGAGGMDCIRAGFDNLVDVLAARPGPVAREVRLVVKPPVIYHALVSLNRPGQNVRQIRGVIQHTVLARLHRPGGRSLQIGKNVQRPAAGLNVVGNAVVRAPIERVLAGLNPLPDEVDTDPVDTGVHHLVDLALLKRAGRGMDA
ncbi:hypothetical protein ES705_48175 [subsurface metagenome]